MGHYYLLLVVCNNNISTLYCFLNITTFIAFMTACDLEKSFSFIMTVALETTCHINFEAYHCVTFFHAVFLQLRL